MAKEGAIGLAYFYCDISDTRKRGVTGLLSSLILDLFAWAPTNQSILEMVYANSQNGLHRPSDTALSNLLRSFISAFQKTYIFIDALDECLNLEEMLEFVKAIHGWHINQCHLLVTSRMEQTIVNSLLPVGPAVLDLSYMPINADIKEYINHTLHSSSELKRWASSEKELIKQTLLAKCGGM